MRTGSLATFNGRIEAIRTTIERSSKSVQHLPVELDILHSTVHEVLRFTLKKKLYHLHDEDLAVHVAMCADLLAANDHTLFSDEVTFHKG